MSGLPTGRQFELRYDGAGETGHRARAVVTELGAMVRVLEFDGVPVIEGFAETAYPLFCAGQILIPWPNRVRDGRWVHGGRERQLPLTEPDRANALHGFLFGLRHELLEHPDAARLTLRARIDATDAYPFDLVVDTTYALGEDTLTVTHAVTNAAAASAGAAPVAIGAHPYFRIGDVPTEQLTLTLNAASRVTVDERLNPTGTAPVEGTGFDLRHGVVVGSLDLDTAYFDLVPDPASPDAPYRHTLVAPDGRSVTVWGDANYSQAQVFTTQIFPRVGGGAASGAGEASGAGGDDRGLGWAVTVEPTTAAPDALNTGADLHWVDPGDTWQSSWGITFSAGSASTEGAPE